MSASAKAGPLEALLEPRGDEADDSRRPSFARHDHRGAALLEPERQQRLRLGLGERRDLDLLPRAVQAVELGGDLARFVLVARGQQPDAKRRVADAAAGVDARADDEAEVIGARRPVGAGDVEQGGEAGPPALAHRRQSARDEGAVEADERHDVGDRRQRDEVEPGEEIGRGAAVEEAAVAQRAVQRDEAHVDDAGGAEMAKSREVVLAVRVDDGECVGQALRRLVMVEDDDVEAEPACFGDRLVADRAAIDRDDEARAARGEGGHRLAVRTITFGDAIGNVDDRFAAAGLEIFAEQRRAAGAVDVVVGEDRDSLRAPHRVGEPRRRLLHVGSDKRIGHQRAQGRIEMARNFLEADAAPGEHPRQQFVAAARLGDRQGARFARRVEARAPRPTGEGTLDAEEKGGKASSHADRARRRIGPRQQPSLSPAAPSEPPPADEFLGRHRRLV